MSNDALIEIFKEEAEELLDKWESIVFDLESEASAEKFDEFFRVAHTLKGSSKAVGLTDFGSFVHHVEDLIKHCQTDNSFYDPEVGQIFLQAHSIMQSWLEEGQPDEDQKGDLETQVTNKLGGSSGDSGKKQTQTTRKKIDKKEEKPKQSNAAAKKQVIRVDKARIDQVMQLVGELSSQLAFIEREMEMRSNVKESERAAMGYANKYLSSLEEISLSLTMQPLDGMFQRLERACRDVANISKKQIVVEKVGGHTELDKTVIEKITEPLIHLVRNGVDHGIEAPDDRTKLGKDTTGIIELNASQESGRVILTITDDGKGIDEEAVLKKAIEKGLVQKGSRPPKSEILRMILQPSFSTKEQVSEVSGRGVGMDVVNTALTELGGSLDIDSNKGKGSIFTITIPTNLSLIESLIIECSKQSYSVPLRECKEIINLSEFKINKTDGYPSILWNEKIVPIVELDSFFGGTSHSKNHPIAIINTVNSNPIAISFDVMQRRQKLFIKPLKGNFENMFAVTGTTILPDGNASVLVSINELSRSYHSKFKGVSNG